MTPGPVSRSRIRVLCVDDEPGLADLVARYLERENDRFDVVTATAASAGLDRIAAEPVDCVVSDYDMPEMNGQAFLEAVRDAYPDLPFILFTGKGSEDVASEAISAGVTDYVQKGQGSDQYAVLANRVENAVIQRRSVEALERQRDFFEKAQAVGDLGAWEYDLETGEAWFSESAYRIHGLSPSHEPSPESGHEFYYEADRPKLEAAFERAVEGGEPYDLEVRFDDEDGDRRWLRIRGEPQHEGGRVVRIRAIVQDVTERVRQDRRYRTLIENLPGIVYRARIEPGWPFEFVHGRSEAFTGYATDELLDDIDWETLIHPDDREMVYDDVTAAVDADERFELRYRIQTRDGLVRWVWERGRAVDAGVLEGFIMDVTDYVANEERLERYEMMVETTGDGVYTLDAEGRITFANDAIAELTGYDRDDVLGEHVSMVLSDADIERGERVIRSLLKTGRERETFEMGIRTRDGEVVPCETQISVLPSDEARRGTVGVIRDVTERNERERALERERDRLEEFADVVSHDLRNPLTLARGNLSWARRDGDPAAFERIERGLDRMERIIEDVLWLARRGRDLGTTEFVSLGVVLGDAWQHVGGESSGAKLVVDESIGSVESDRDRLCQFFENILRNAIDHGGPNVTVHAEATPDGFAIEDDGPGIAEADRERVFDRGYTTASEGTGLGLYIVRSIADAHGWDLAVTTGREGGARFEVTIDP